MALFLHLFEHAAPPSFLEVYVDHLSLETILENPFVARSILEYTKDNRIIALCLIGNAEIKSTIYKCISNGRIQAIEDELSLIHNPRQSDIEYANDMLKQKLIEMHQHGHIAICSSFKTFKTLFEQFVNLGFMDFDCRCSHHFLPTICNNQDKECLELLEPVQGLLTDKNKRKFKAIKLESVFWSSI